MPGTPTSGGPEATRAAHLAGSGLGLYLTASFVREHGANTALVHSAIAKWENRGAPNNVGELAAITGLDAQQVTQSLGYLAEHGMIELSPDRSRLRVVTK
jgi:DNA-binding MarR family transcriptional regulator